MSASEETFSQEDTTVTSIEKRRRIVGGVLRDVLGPFQEFGANILYIIGVKPQIGKKELQDINTYIELRAHHNNQIQRLLPTGELNPMQSAANDSAYYENQKLEAQKLKEVA